MSISQREYEENKRLEELSRLGPPVLVNQDYSNQVPGHLGNALAQHGHNLASQGVIGMGPQMIYPDAKRPTSASIVRQNRERLLAQARVLEYIEAQLNMKLFGEDLLCASLFEQAMVNAAHQLVNGTYKS